MQSLAGYGSDDETDASPASNKPQSTDRDAMRPSRSRREERDVNYEEVQMDLSEDSNEGGSGGGGGGGGAAATRTTEQRTRDERRRTSPKRVERERDRDRDGKRREDRHRDERYETHRRDRGSDERTRSRDKDRHRSGREEKRDNRSRHTDSRERQKSRSPSSRRSRRSSSRERRKSRPYDRLTYRMDRIEKLGIDMKQTAPLPLPESKIEDTANKGRFFMPGISGRFTEQIQRRKMLWQKPKGEESANGGEANQGECASGGGSASGVTSLQQPPPPAPVKLWQNTTFAQDTDGKVADKFKRLMGIRGAGGGQLQEGGGGGDDAQGTTDILRKQEEMFSTMEAQYEVARTVTHTMRGVGLGFGSFQR